MPQSFDYIVIGGGSSGAVVAGRLTEDPATSVCVLEAGGGGNSLVVNIPAATVAMVPTRLNNWAFETVPQKGLNGRRGYQPRGKGLGGSSAINAMIYVRGHREDYDRWESLGNPGWGYEDVLPYFIRSEHNTRLGAPWHGQDGPFWVSDSFSDNPIHSNFIAAAHEAGFPVSDDFNGAEQEGLGLYQVTQRNGERWSAARGYLRPYMGKRPNLTVETRAMASRILFDGKRAVGVEFERGGQRHVVHARREVILSAGALQSPQILMLSGVGPADQLRSHGLQVIHDSPGVGENLQDHPDFVFAFKTRGYDAFGISAIGSAKMAAHIVRYARNRHGMLASNVAEGGGFLKTRNDLSSPDIQLHFVLGIVQDHARKLPLGHGISCHVCVLRPKSVGTVKLASSNFRDIPLIDPAFLEDPEDLETLVAGFKMTRRLLEAPSLASLITRDLVTSNVHTDDDIRAVLRAHADSVYHPVGTCRMGSDANAVVDPELRVRGVEGLRVVDASVMPTLIGGNTNAPAVMIGEKASDLIRGKTIRAIAQNENAFVSNTVEAAHVG